MCRAERRQQAARLSDSPVAPGREHAEPISLARRRGPDIVIARSLFGAADSYDAMLVDTPADEYAATLDRCAEDALWEANVDWPPVDAFVVAKRLRLRVTTNDALRERARFVRPQQHRSNRVNGLIVLGPEERPERRQWAVAHEIGEAIAYRVFETLGVDPAVAPDLERERVANALAGRLLAPRRWLNGVARDTEADLFALKEVFATASHELLARRLLECRRDPLVVSVFDNGQLTWRRWRAASGPPPMAPVERACREQSHARNEPAWEEPLYADERVVAPIARVRCWPVHEADWRREILLTELYEP